MRPETAIDIIRNSRLEAEEMLSILYMCRDWKVAHVILRTMKLDAAQIFRALEMVKHSKDLNLVVKAAAQTGKLDQHRLLVIIEFGMTTRDGKRVISEASSRVNWSLLSKKEMLDFWKRVDRNLHIAQHIVKSGRFSEAEMLTILEESFDDPTVASAVVETGNFSLRDKFSILKTVKGSREVARAMEKDIHWSTLTTVEMREILDQSNNNTYFAQKIIERGNPSEKTIFNILMRTRGSNDVAEVASKVLKRRNEKA